MKKCVFCVAALAAGMSLMAQTVYQKVITNPTDWSGTYLIVCEGQCVVFNGAADEEHIDAKGGAAILPGITFTDGVLAGTDALNAATFTISASGDEDWPWAIQSASGLYIGHKDSVVADNGLSAETTLKNKCKHTLSIDESGNLIATPRWTVGQEFNLQYNKKEEQQRFRYFLPEDKLAVQLYKLQEPGTDITEIEMPSHYKKCFENGRVIIYKNEYKYNILGQKL